MPRIPIVNNVAFVRTGCAQALGEKRYEVVEIVDGIEAPERYVGNNPDVVLMDIIMSHTDGMTALRRLMDSPATRYCLYKKEVCETCQ